MLFAVKKLPIDRDEQKILGGLLRANLGAKETRLMSSASSKYVRETSLFDSSEAIEFLLRKMHEGKNVNKIIRGRYGLWAGLIVQHEGVESYNEQQSGYKNRKYITKADRIEAIGDKINEYFRGLINDI